MAPKAHNSVPGRAPQDAVAPSSPVRRRRRLSAPARPVPVPLPLFPERVILARIRPERNERRYYRLEIVTDLFGTVGLARTWGRIGRSARMRFDPLPDLGTALNTLAALARGKRRRGYQDMRSGW